MAMDALPPNDQTVSVSLSLVAFSSERRSRAQDASECVNDEWTSKRGQPIEDRRRMERGTYHPCGLGHLRAAGLG